ncbi:MAG: copper chaperone PCu(A)C [Caenispirillum sp.]|jgi:copper(I)-binding protein|nr:copper chaperone PCu(A)C [Caenispirillum sp.]
MQKRKFVTMFLFGAIALAQPGFAADALKVDEARVVAPVPGQTVAAAYMVLESPKDARVVAAESDVADSVQIHTMSMQGDVMRMRRVEALDLPARRPVQLAPGGTHLMLFGLRGKLRPGGTVALRLTVTEAGGANRIVSLSLPVADGPHAHGGRHD